MASEMTRPTDLEACVLGLIGQQDECTAYELRQLFQRSPTSSWRASTGTIYPLVKKLNRLGYVSSREAGDGRRTRLLALTAAGRQVLRQWLKDTESVSGDATADPFRTRLLFLAELKPGERRRFLQEAVARTDTAIEALRKTTEVVELEEDRFTYLAHLGALAELEARRAWVEKVRTELAKSHSP